MRPVLGSLCALVLAVSAACAGGGRAGPDASSSASASAEPTFLADETLCGGIPATLLDETFAVRPTRYMYYHYRYDFDSRIVKTFRCEIEGWDSSSRFVRILIFYDLNGRQNLPFGNAVDFEDLDTSGMEPVSFDGAEGNGYIWLGKRSEQVRADWLYPDNYVMEIQVAPDHVPSDSYDQDDLDTMSTFLQGLIPVVSEIAGREESENETVPSSDGSESPS